VYAVLDCNPVIIIGEDEPVPVYPPGEDVTVYVAPGTVPGVNATEACPLLNDLPVPWFVATTDVGAVGTAPIGIHVVPL